MKLEDAGVLGNQVFLDLGTMSPRKNDMSIGWAFRAEKGEEGRDT